MSASNTAPSIPNLASSAAPIIIVRNLVRSFGPVQAVAGVSFDIFPGQVVGFIGANGAGKTTTMRMMATLDIPDGGVVRICGHDAISEPYKVRRKIGWMPDEFGRYDNVTVWEYLDFYARAYGFHGDERKRRIEEVMDFADLRVIADRHMDKLSKGMGQRLCLGRTLLHDPEVLIMDEPAAGLDPRARIELKNLIRLLAQEGKTIFISSHILSELGEMCDTLLFIDAGRLVHHGSSESLTRNDGAQIVVEIELDGPVAALVEWAQMNPGLTLTAETKRGARFAVEDASPAALAATLRRMIESGLPVAEFHRMERRLEDAFVDMLSRTKK